MDAPIARIAAQIHPESTWEPTAESAYARGLSQFTPPTAAWLPTVCPEVGPPDPWDAGLSLRAITCYDAWLLQRVDGTTACDEWAFTLSGYNGGFSGFFATVHEHRLREPTLLDGSTTSRSTPGAAPRTWSRTARTSLAF